MLGITCALIGSLTYIFIATKVGLLVFITHFIIGSVISIGIATVSAS